MALRTAIVLGRGSVMIPLTGLTRFGLGGPQLDGRWPATRWMLESGSFAIGTETGLVLKSR